MVKMAGTIEELNEGKMYCPTCLVRTVHYRRARWASIYDMYCPECRGHWHFGALLTEEEVERRRSGHGE